MSVLRRKPGLDLVRAVAILLVLISHFSGWYFTTSRPWFLVWTGYVGVELFFVLSGYLIGGIVVKAVNAAAGAGQGHGSFTRNFWIRRWMRTIPCYLFYLTLALIILPTSHMELTEILSYFLFVQSLFAPMGEFFGVSWSLSVEEWFYLLFPLLILAPRILGIKAASDLKVSVWFSVGMLLLVPTILRFYNTMPNWDQDLRKVTLFRLDSIAFGVALASIESYYPRIWNFVSSKSALAFGIVVMAFVIAHVCLNYSNNWGSGDSALAIFNRVFFVSVTGVGCAILTANASRLRSMPSSVGLPVLHLSLISYSLYLSHSLVIFWVDQQSEGNFLEAHRLLAVALMVILSIGVSLLTYWFLEFPVLKLRDRLSLSK